MKAKKRFLILTCMELVWFGADYSPTPGGNCPFPPRFAPT